ncbi:radical SAM protein [Candidatus Shapirobacteria bacterium]|nr:radical SAM protein [Candidatus Shapirobacteria bacterium]
MKVAITYPPLADKKGTPLLSQNRQFQWFHHPCYIYPMIPAQAATLLKKAGHEVFWLDGIAEGWTYDQWLKELKQVSPDLLIMETKTPVIKKHWQIINNLKSKMPSMKFVLVGDHVTALPEESFQKSKVDYVLTGGDYDFLLLNLVNHLTKKEKLQPGVYYREGKKIKNTGKFQLNHDLNKIPFIDRELTKWKLYAYENGNYKRTPGTYIMAGRDCWWRKDGGCKFCAWTVLYPTYHVRKPQYVLDEIDELIEKYHVKEVMDDTGTFIIGNQLREFCRGMIKRGYNKKIYFDCNLRFGALKKEDYRLMAKAGFRFLLYGLESANQQTLDKLNKGIKVDEIEQELRMAKRANQEVGGHLEPHVTCMVGYPWEDKKDAQKTIEMTKSLFAKGLINTLQATIIIPYPGTALFKECQKRGWLKTKNWEDYDMSKPVMKTSMKDEEVMELTQGLYKSFLTPRFIIRKVVSVKSFDDMKFFWRAGKAVFGHLADFGGGKR